MNYTGKPKVITVHRNRCIGCGYCLSVENNFWVISPNDGKITIREFISTNEQTLKVTVPIEILDSVIDSCENCPESVFKL
ncbi:MAG TPA: ferredoxin [Tenuifilaceae bacterium]|nr:ferredoxin [Tenuifilaceae bacterium]HOZ15430.1 ferredoxin [Tenuifilaceae bacterium]HPI45443.1 ferredoxin [Tenuifilaceae bacterium]HPN22748.1 ferredoxin [Tenuifilaceae bacterium]